MVPYFVLQNFANDFLKLRWLPELAVALNSNNIKCRNSVMIKQHLSPKLISIVRSGLSIYEILLNLLFVTSWSCLEWDWSPFKYHILLSPCQQPLIESFFTAKENTFLLHSQNLFGHTYLDLWVRHLNQSMSKSYINYK